jgi:branched-chain amino acid transport system permease protein
MGPSGVANISRPGLFGIHLNIFQTTDYIYYLMVALMLITVFITTRLKNSRIGRAWVALREDEIASVAMGIDMATTKLTAYALGGALAGLVGVIFAAKTTFINPDSFTFMESAIVLSIVVLGGMGSILGVILAAFVLILLPEYLRAFSEYRMLVFGASLVLMMVFRPEGLISNVRRRYELHEVPEETGS